MQSSATRAQESAEDQTIDATPPAIPTQGLGSNLHQREPLLNLFWILCGIAICIYSFRLGVFGPSGPDSGFFPMLAGAVMTLAGVALLFTRGARVETTRHFWPEQASARRVSMVLGGLILMTLLTRFAGFLTAAVIVMPLLLRAIEGRSWRFAITVGVVSAGIVFFLFDTLLGTLLPRGPWGF
jgi:putative tricarboxylic transport membrane protein